MTTWAAKVLEGVPRWTIDEGRGAFLSEADALAAIARMGAGDGWFDVFKNIAAEAERVAAYEKTRAEAAEAEAADARAEALREAAALFDSWWICAPDGSNMTQDVQDAILALIPEKQQ